MQELGEEAANTGLASSISCFACEAAAGKVDGYMQQEVLGLFIVIYSYLLSFSLASIWMENNYNNSKDKDNSVIFNIKSLNKFQCFYFSFLLIVLLLPFSWFLVLFIKFLLFSAQAKVLFLYLKGLIISH